MAFYRAVLGARIDEIGTGGAPDAVRPSFWQVYITVDDVAATVKQAEALGAEILMPGEDTPHGRRRCGIRWAR
ncbi:hypothetical protein MSAR_32680 [Mycolicibacterium sarraceniae]|uniref:Glyoxalase/fosfomycin resistance/dioxygenase domain-containing protein n=1 Tax=Mycolicibacterium sarraceniae TaxID=1534348 RepID=A0A7I7ST03_9MYCO|nr:hypothetical protein MSAR_32680 [Mycolicibacterium sarraceniae]